MSDLADLPELLPDPSDRPDAAGLPRHDVADLALAAQ
ncbi:hypothetical protein, partial [Frankia sp. CpI1-P]